MMRAGFCGIGNMGRGMAANLARSSELARVYVFDVENARVNELQSALTPEQRQRCIAAASPADLGLQTNVVCLSLPSEDVAFKAIFGANGVASSWMKDQSTRKDAPVSGGPEGASNGTLTIMVGGAEKDYTTCLPVLRAMGTKVKLMGDTGAGIATKLINQLLVGAHALAASEALQLAEDLGVHDVPALLDTLNSSWGNSIILQICGQQYLSGKKNGEESLMRSSAPLRNLTKDFSCIMKSTTSSTASYPITEAVAEHLREAHIRGLEHAEFAMLRKTLVPKK